MNCSYKKLTKQNYLVCSTRIFEYLHNEISCAIFDFTFLFTGSHELNCDRKC